jgi:hypothetical protein
MSETLTDTAAEELLAARAAWIEARQQRAIKDSPGNRRVEEAAWLDCWAAFELWDDSRS